MALEPRTKIEKKKIQITNYLFVYAAPTPSGFAENPVTVRPEDTVSYQLGTGWRFVNGQTGTEVLVFEDKVLWWERQEREIEVLVE